MVPLCHVSRRLKHRSRLTLPLPKGYKGHIILLWNSNAKAIGGVKMGKDRQEKKLGESGRVESDRDQALDKPGATQMESPDEARSRNKG